MNTEQHTPLSDRAIWIVIAVVFLSVLTILLALYNHEKQKPDSPHALAAAAFNQLFAIKEWQPGLGPKPLLYHPAAQVHQQPLQQLHPMQNQNPAYAPRADGLIWRPLPRPSQGGHMVPPRTMQTHGPFPQ